MDKKFVVRLEEADVRPLHVDWGTSRRLIDGDTCGAKHFTLYVNTLKAGIHTEEIKHDTEQGWYVLSGRGKIIMEGQPLEIGPQTAIFAPATSGTHRFEVEPGEDMTYVLVFAPPKVY